MIVNNRNPLKTGVLTMIFSFYTSQYPQNTNSNFFLYDDKFFAAFLYFFIFYLPQTKRLPVILSVECKNKNINHTTLFSCQVLIEVLQARNGMYAHKSKDLTLVLTSCPIGIIIMALKQSRITFFIFIRSRLFLSEHESPSYLYRLINAIIH